MPDMALWWSHNPPEAPSIDSIPPAHIMIETYVACGNASQSHLTGESPDVY
jgi:hypothetical protein